MHKSICSNAVDIAAGAPSAPVTRRQGLLSVFAIVGVSICLGGCSYALPSFPMPDLVRDPRKFLSKEEQQQAINDLSQKKATQEAEAARQAAKPK